MVKRSWEDAELDEVPPRAATIPSQYLTGSDGSISQPTARHGSGTIEGPNFPAISRKVKACAACRKQKVRLHCAMVSCGLTPVRSDVS